MLRRNLHYTFLEQLEKVITTDNLKIEFWLTIYNAFITHMTKESNNGEIDYEKKRIKVAQNLLSLIDMKFGILRIPKCSISLLNINLFKEPIIKK